MEESARTDPIDNNGRIGRSLRLTGVAWRLIRSDRTMLALVGISTVLVLTSAVLIFAVGGYSTDPDQSTPHLALVYVIASFPITWIATYLNVALAAAASEALDGRRLALRQALAASNGRLLQITTWTLLLTVVGVLIREVLSRIPGAGRLVSVLAGAAWSIATLFAIPILALEGCSALSCAQRSVALFKERWGEGVTGSVVIVAWTVLAAIGGVMVVFVGLGVQDIWSGVAGIVLIAVGLAALLMVSAFGSTVREVFAVALFRYARDGAALGGFVERDLARPLARRRWGGG